ncbi:MAG: EAL domain-containing protein [Silicimonas sp.]|nr:EAL domain-containing protein [Silicimonas sp.]
MTTLNKKISLAPGELLYRQGDRPDTFFIIEEGVVLLYTEVDGKRIEVETRCDGMLLGETAVLTAKPRAVTVEALTDCKLFELPASQITERFNELDPILRACVESSIDFSLLLVNDDEDPRLNLTPGSLHNANELLEQMRAGQEMCAGLKSGDFQMLFQPIMRLEDETISGFEALMRWQHPMHGGVAPGRFITVAENIGIIGELTRFALIESCAALSRIIATTGRDDLYVSVNISAQDLGWAGLIDFLDHVLDQAGLWHQNLRLELTETALAPKSLTAEQNLIALKQKGYLISIDDFGTGYSNLRYLKTMPLRTIKIDRSFVADADQSEVSRSIIKLLLAFGKDVGADIVAEGVEGPDQVAMLREMGCPFVQGYHYGRPMSEADMTDRIMGRVAQSISA